MSGLTKEKVLELEEKTPKKHSDYSFNWLPIIAFGVVLFWICVVYLIKTFI